MQREVHMTKKAIAVILSDGKVGTTSSSTEQSLPECIVENVYNFYLGNVEERPFAAIRRYLKSQGIQLLLIDDDPVCVVSKGINIVYYYLFKDDSYIGKPQMSFIPIDELQDHEQLVSVLKTLESSK